MIRGIIIAVDRKRVASEEEKKSYTCKWWIQDNFLLKLSR